MGARSMSAAAPLDVRAAFRFLRALSKNNHRAWFNEHRDEYAALKGQFEDFVAGLLIAATRFDARFARVEPRRCIFRIFRDIRFAKDKTPYKTRLSAFLSPLGWRGSTPGFYVALEPGGESMMAAGIYVPEKPVLADLRQRFAAGDPAFDRLMRSKRFAAYLPLDTDPLARLPRGFDRDHPRAELIRARRYMVRRPFGDAELTAGNAFGLFAAALRDTAPFVAWLDKSLAAAQTNSLRRSFEPLDAGFE